MSNNRIPPYVMADGSVIDQIEVPEQVFGREPTSAKGVLALRARRARLDPLWATRSRESKQRLLDLDAREQRR